MVNGMKKIIKYMLLCIFFFISLVFIFTLSRGDTFVNYGFSYAISIGEIPYKDFNMVITPLSPFVYSIGLILCKNILVYYLEQAILLTVLFYILEKLINKKSILYLLFILIPYPIAIVSTIFPGYNFLIILLFFIFIYLFKNKKSDYLLGLVLGLIFCTKQTIGIALFIPIIYYLFKNRKKFIKIFIGYLIPIFILLIYLLLTNTLNSFIDLCILGLFDFNNSNRSIDIYYLIICKIIKKKDILLSFGLMYITVIFPIIDYYHVSLFLLIVIYFLIEDKKIKDSYYKYIIIFIIGICGIWSFITYEYFNPPVISNYNNFYLVINNKKYTNNSKKLLEYTKNKNTIYFMRGSENYYYKIISNKKINYFDLPNNGNYGYNGINKMKNKIQNTHKVYFVLDKELINSKDNNQYIDELGIYVIKNSNKIKSIGPYDIYYKE